MKQSLFGLNLIKITNNTATVHYFLDVVLTFEIHLADKSFMEPKSKWGSNDL